MNKKLWLIGAGPGDPDLISLKAVKVLRKAKVILYDALVNEAILTHAPENTLCLCVGKRAGKHSHSQEEIHQLILQYTHSHGEVIRLKGGDPFVFGRGYEEIAFAQLWGIEVEVVPGMSSVTSLATLQQVPLTHRGASESIWVVTGTTRRGGLSDDLIYAAQSTATIVILMGMKKLKEIVTLFAEYEKADSPAMIIQNGSYAHEKSVVGTVATLPTLARQAEMSTPATIIIGQVVRFHPQYCRQQQLLINGRTQ